MTETQITGYWQHIRSSWSEYRATGDSRARNQALVQCISILLLFAGVLLAYLPFLSETVQESDGGEIATAAVTGSIVHPPGYPLFMVVNRVFLFLVQPSNPYFALCFLNALFQAMAGVLLVHLAFLLLSRDSFGIRMLLAYGIALSWSFYSGVIRTVSDAEVFSFHHLLTVLFITFVFRKILEGKARISDCFLLGVGAGLCSSHHHAIVLWAPLVLVAIFQGRSLRQGISGVALSLLGTLIGLSPYLLLPFLFEGKPLVFYPPESVRELVAYVLRFAYGTFSLSREDSFDLRSYFDYFFQTLVSSAPLLVLVFPLAVLYLFRAKWTLLVSGIIATLSLHLLFVYNIFLPSNSLIHGFYALRFFGLVALCISVCLLFFFSEGVPVRLKRIVSVMAFVVSLVVPSLLWPLLRDQLSNRDDKTVHAELTSIFGELPKESVFVAGLDRLAMGLMYHQQVYHQREDIDVVVPAMLTDSRYRAGLEASYPGLHFSIEAHPLRTLVEFFRSKGRRVFSYYETPLPEGYSRWPIGISFEWKEVGAPTPSAQEVLRTLLNFCERWPLELGDIARSRFHSLEIRKKIFLYPLVFQLLEVLPEERWPEVQELRETLLSGKIEESRELCRSFL